MGTIRHIHPQVAAKMRASAKAFQGKEWPLIAADFAGRFETVEGKTHDETLAKLLDTSGIDAFVVREEPHRMYGLAARTWDAWVQGNGEWSVPNGFSIRHSIRYGDVCYTNCEYDKLRFVFLEYPEGGAVHPHYTVQATFLSKSTDERPIYIAVTKTSELICFIHDHMDDRTCVIDRGLGDARFYDVPTAAIADQPSFREYLFERTGFTIRSYTQGGIERGYWVFEDAVYQEADAS